MRLNSKERKIASLCMEFRRVQDKMAVGNFADGAIERLAELENEIQSLVPDKKFTEIYKESGVYRKKYLVVDYLLKKYCVIFEPVLTATKEEEDKFKAVLDSFRNNPHADVTETADFEPVPEEETLISRGFKESFTFDYDGEYVKEILLENVGKEVTVKYNDRITMITKIDGELCVNSRPEKMKDIKIFFMKELIILTSGMFTLEIAR